MKVDTARVAADELAALIRAEYRLDVASVTFVPWGEDAYNYAV